MGKHLSVEEKLNASKELEEIRVRMSELRFERGKLKYLSRINIASLIGLNLRLELWK